MIVFLLISKIIKQIQQYKEKATEIKANKYIHKGKIIDFMIIQTSNYSSLKKKEGDKSWFSWKNKKE